MPKGNKLAYLNSPMTDNSPIDFDDNAKMIQCVIDNFDRPLPDLSNAKEVEKAIKDYFNTCLSKGLRPGNLGLYAALGLDKRQVNDMLNGRIRLNASPQTIGLLKKACAHLTEFREMLGSSGKLNPAVLIFWQKNFDNLSDIQQIDLNPVSMTATKTPEEIAAEIDEIPTD